MPVNTLGEKDKKSYEQHGFMGPFPAFFSESEIDSLNAEFLEMATLQSEHPLYHRFSVRDWHLMNPAAFALITHPAIVDRVVPISCENLILWRSKIFHKRPGDGEIGWHQEWGAFNGEEIGNNKPSLASPNPIEENWDWTIWIALCDITPENGPMQFLKNSHKTRYPIRMVPMIESAAYHDPFLETDNPEVIIGKALDNSLVLDIATDHIFDGINPYSLTFNQLRSHINQQLAHLKAAITLPFECTDDDLETIIMKKGEFLIFTERAMHRSLPNTTNQHRLALNCRFTKGDTLVYPQRLNGDFIDGSNIDISQHRCVKLCGIRHHPDNVYTPTKKLSPV